MRPILRSLQISLLIAVFSMSAWGQKTEVTVSQPFKRSLYANFINTPNGYIGFEQTGVTAKLVFTLKMENVTYGLKLISYDKNMKQIKELKLENGEKNFGPFNPIFREEDDKYYILYYRFGKDPASQFKLMSAEIDPATLTLKKEELILDIDVRDPKGRALDMLKDMKIRIERSPDDSKLALMWFSGIRNEYYVAGLDKNMKVQWEKKIITRYPKQIIAGSMAVDNSGTVYSTYSSVDDKENILRVVATDQKRTTEQDIVIEGVKPHQVEILPSTGETPVQLVGTYKTTNDLLAGIFHQRIKADLRSSSTTKTEFSTKVLEFLKDDDWAVMKSKRSGVTPFGFGAVRTDDDNIAFTGEFRRLVHGTRTTSVIAGHVVAALIDNGKATISILPKARVSAASSAGDSFMGVATAGKLIIFYNDYPKNLEKPIDGDLSKTSMFNMCVLAAAVMEKDGSFKRFQVLDMKKEKMVMVPEQAFYSNGAVHIPGFEYGGMGHLKDEAVIATITFK